MFLMNKMDLTLTWREREKKTDKIKRIIFFIHWQIVDFGQYFSAACLFSFNVLGKMQFSTEIYIQADKIACSLQHISCLLDNYSKHSDRKVCTCAEWLTE